MSHHASLARASIILYLLLMLLLIVVVVTLWGFSFRLRLPLFMRKGGWSEMNLPVCYYVHSPDFDGDRFSIETRRDYSADTTCVGVSLACCVVHPRLREHMVERLVKFY
jgi:hypothetical protein